MTEERESPAGSSEARKKNGESINYPSLGSSLPQGQPVSDHTNDTQIQATETEQGDIPFGLIRSPLIAAREYSRQGWPVLPLHSVKDGPADRSYGLHVAALAGLPGDVLARARTILEDLERGRASDLPSAPSPQMGLFEQSRPHPIIEALEKLDPDECSPRQALELLFELKRLGDTE